MAELRFFEDFRFGETFTTGTQEVRIEEAVGFAGAWDPQSFHVDEDAAKEHPVFRGLSASGLFTLAVTHRLIVAKGLGHAWGLIGKGMDQLRWLKPVRPGDVLHVQGRLIGLSREPDKPFGTILTSIETLNQDGDRVLSLIAQTVVPIRSAPPVLARAS